MRLALLRIDPETTSMELQVDKAISKLREASIQMGDKFMKDVRQFVDDVLESEGEQKNQLIEEYEGKGAAALKEIATHIKNLETLRNENNREHSAISPGVTDILRKIGGTGIGKVGEAITIQDLKRAHQWILLMRPELLSKAQI
ncbi:MAG: hypothetical protein WA667_18905 [Candidatus Nitrosopolaris sp.]